MIAQAVTKKEALSWYLVLIYSSSEASSADSSEEISNLSLINLAILLTLFYYWHFFKNTCRIILLPILKP